MTVTLDPVMRSPSKKNKPKWHLGIRSQSKPLDIMDEVYKVRCRVADYLGSMNAECISEFVSKSTGTFPMLEALTELFSWDISSSHF